MFIFFKINDRFIPWYIQKMTERNNRFMDDGLHDEREDLMNVEEESETEDDNSLETDSNIHNSSSEEHASTLLAVAEEELDDNADREMGREARLARAVFHLLGGSQSRHSLHMETAKIQSVYNLFWSEENEQAHLEGYTPRPTNEMMIECAEIIAHHLDDARIRTVRDLRAFMNNDATRLWLQTSSSDGFTILMTRYATARVVDLIPERAAYEEVRFEHRSLYGELIELFGHPRIDFSGTMSLFDDESRHVKRKEAWFLLSRHCAHLLESASTLAMGLLNHETLARWLIYRASVQSRWGAIYQFIKHMRLLIDMPFPPP